MLQIIYCLLAFYAVVLLIVGLFKQRNWKDQLTACVILIPLIMRSFLIR